jgi:hypothetical protein
MPIPQCPEDVGADLISEGQEVSAHDELVGILRDSGMQDFMDDKRIGLLADTLLEYGVRTPIQTAVLVQERNAARMDRNELKTRIMEYESAISWQLNCLNCSRLMDQNYEQYARIERIKEKLTEAQEI